MQQKHSGRRCAVFVITATSGAIATHAFAAITGTVLFPLTPESGYGVEPLYARGGQVTGLHNGPGSNPNHGAVWTASGPIDLNPSQFTSSLVFATTGTQQVGWGSSGSNTHPLLWTGTAASAVDLLPARAGITSGEAEGTNGTQQVGYIGGTATSNVAHAAIWTGTAASALDIHPTNISIAGSQAVATDGVHQVGNGQGTATGNQTWAILWSGTANSAVLLNPTGYSQSFALGVAGTQQVGWGFKPSFGDRGLLWTGSAASAIDLTPTNLSGFNGSTASGTNGFQQVGWAEGPATGSHVHAMFWSGTANSAVDLQSLLPTSGLWTDSQAYTIDAAGNIYGIANGTLNGVTGYFGVEWTVPVPEPSSGVIVLLAGMTSCLRRRSKLRP